MPGLMTGRTYLRPPHRSFWPADSFPKLVRLWRIRVQNVIDLFSWKLHQLAYWEASLGCKNPIPPKYIA